MASQSPGGFKRESAKLAITTSSGKRREGLARSSGALGTVVGGTIARVRNGWPVDSQGRVCLSAGSTIAKVRYGLPVDSAGRVVVSTGVGAKTKANFLVDAANRLIVNGTAAENLEIFQKRSEEAKAAGKLLYSPPAQSNPEILEAPAGTTFYGPEVKSASKDAILKMPATVRKRGIEVSKARHLRVIGGESNLTGGNLTQTPLRTGNNSGSFFVEGVLMNGGEGTKDLVNISGTSGTGPFSLFPDFYMQRCRGESIHGTAAGEHADLFQPQGSMGTFYCWLYTGYGQYQGLYLPPIKPITNVYLDYVNLGYEAGGDPTTYMLWFLEKSGEKNKPATYDIYLGKNVYVTPKEGQTITSCVWPPPGQVDTNNAPVGAEEFEVEGKKAVKFPAASRIYGYVKEGPPAGGDFVPKANCGIGYTSPGYFS